jgi:hypothetical protein
LPIIPNTVKVKAQCSLHELARIKVNLIKYRNEKYPFENLRSIAIPKDSNFNARNIIEDLLRIHKRRTEEYLRELSKHHGAIFQIKSAGVFSK